MKIDKTSKPLPPASSNENRPRAPAAKSGDAAAAGGTSVNLGATSAQLQNLESSMASTPLVDAAKVAEIRQAISEGRFKVQSSAVADSLIQSVTDLINARKA
ncbi:MAG: flagellar biosynthesis anti-sigma factor FlgM [Pseudomonadota bacterium]